MGQARRAYCHAHRRSRKCCASTGWFRQVRPSGPTAGVPETSPAPPRDHPRARPTPRGSPPPEHAGPRSRSRAPQEADQRRAARPGHHSYEISYPQHPTRNPIARRLSNPGNASVGLREGGATGGQRREDGGAGPERRRRRAGAMRHRQRRGDTAWRRKDGAGVGPGRHGRRRRALRLAEQRGPVGLGRKGAPPSAGPGAARVSACRSPLGEWLSTAPAERYSVQAMGEARGHWSR